MDKSTRTSNKAVQTSFEVEREGTWQNSFYESSENIVLKLDKDTTRETKKPISMMNTDTKFLSQVIRSRIQQHIKKNHAL